MENLKLNKFFVKDSLSDEAYTSTQLSYDEKRLLAVLSYHFRKLHKCFETEGHLLLNCYKLMYFLHISEDELDDACFNISELGYARVEQYGDYYLFVLNIDRTVNEKYRRVDVQRAIAAQMQQRIAEHNTQDSK